MKSLIQILAQLRRGHWKRHNAIEFYIKKTGWDKGRRRYKHIFNHRQDETNGHPGESLVT